MVGNGHPCLVPTRGARRYRSGGGYFIGIAVSLSGGELRDIAQVHWLDYNVLELPWSLGLLCTTSTMVNPSVALSPPLVTQISPRTPKSIGE